MINMRMFRMTSSSTAVITFESGSEGADIEGRRNLHRGKRTSYSGMLRKSGVL